MEGVPGDAPNTGGAAASASTAVKEKENTLAASPSASRIPLPTGEHGARSATHLASLVAGSGSGAPVTTARPGPGPGPGPGRLPVLAEGGSSLASPAATSPATASPARHPSDHLLDQRDHAPLDIRHSGDCALMGEAGEHSAPGLRAQGDAAGAGAEAAAPAAAQAAPPSAPQGDPPAPAGQPAAPSPAPAPHALLVEAVCSRSRLGPAAAPSRELLADTPAPASAVPPQLLGGRSATFDMNASDVFLSTSTSLDQGLAPPEDNKAPMVEAAAPASIPLPQPIPEVIVTGATPPSVTPPEAVPAPQPQPLPAEASAAVAQEPVGAPPPPPPTPAHGSAQGTPDRKTSPVAPAAPPGVKRAAKAASTPKTNAKTTGIVAKSSATRRPSGTSHLGGAGLHGAKDDASVTLIKAPPAAGARPASARNVRSATTTGTVTTDSAGGGRAGAALGAASGAAAKRPSVQGSATARTNPTAAKSASATVNRKASVSANDSSPGPRLEQPSARPKSTHGPYSARGRPTKELSSLSTSGGGSKTDAKPSGTPLDAKPESHAACKAEATQRPQPRASKDAPLSSGAGEDIAGLKSIGASQEVWPTCMTRLDEELKGMTAPYLVLVAELASRHAVLLDAIKDKDAATHAEEAQFSVTLAHRQAEALRTTALQADRMREVLRAVCSEEAGMRALLEAENTELVRKLEECTQDLERERAASSKTKTSKTAQDSALKQMRSRIKELETKAEAKAIEDENKSKEQCAQITSLKEKLRARNAVLELRTKDLEAVQARLAELQSLESTKQQLDKRLGSVTQMLQIETKTREKAENQLKATTEKLSQMEMSRADIENGEIRAERDRLKVQLEEMAERNASDLEQLRGELTRVMEQLEARSQQLENKDAELRHYLSLRPGETTREELDLLKETFAQLVTHNERLEQELSHCRQELAQRDKIMTEQENVLRVRDHLINALHNRDQQEHGGGLWPQDVVDGRRLIEASANLERKSVRCRAQEQHIKQLERQVESLQNLRISMEKRNAQLEHLVAEFSKQALLAGKHCAPRCNVALM